MSVCKDEVYSSDDSAKGVDECDCEHGMWMHKVLSDSEYQHIYKLDEISRGYEHLSKLLSKHGGESKNEELKHIKKMKENAEKEHDRLYKDAAARYDDYKARKAEAKKAKKAEAKKAKKANDNSKRLVCQTDHARTTPTHSEKFARPAPPQRVYCVTDYAGNF